MKTSVRLALLAILISLVSACVSNRTVALMPEQTQTIKNAEFTKTAIIKVVSDQRVFEDKPRQAHIPSLKGGKAASASVELKARAIARKRSPYGRAKGDVVLPEGQTVTALVHTRVSNALQQAGYQVVATQDIPADLIVEVKIDKLWMWVRPEVWAVRVNSQIETLISTNVAKPFMVKNKHSVVRPVVINTLWAEVLDESLNQYEDELTDELKKLP